MTVKEALQKLKTGNIYDDKGYLTSEGYLMLDTLEAADLIEIPTPELKTENGITYPAALDQMTFTHELSVEERQNINRAFLIGFTCGIEHTQEDVWKNKS